MRMEEIFTQLKMRGCNDLEHLIKWMAKARVIDPSNRETEQWLLNLFRDVPDAKDIKLDKFKEVVNAFAEVQDKTMEEMSARLVRQMPTVLGQVVDSCPGIYVAAPGSEKLSIFSRVTTNSDMSTVTDYSQLINQDSSNSEVAGSNGQVAGSNGEVAAGSQGELAACSKGDVTDCNIQVVTDSQTEVSDDSPGEATPQSKKSNEV